MVSKNSVTGKVLVRTYSYSDLYTDRNISVREIVNGREIEKYGTRTAITMSGYLFDKATDVEPLKYFLLVGIARQPVTGYENNGDYQTERAEVNALINPVIVLETDTIPSEDDFHILCRFWSQSLLKPKLLLTPEEKNPQLPREAVPKECCRKARVRRTKKSSDE